MHNLPDARCRCNVTSGHSGMSFPGDEIADSAISNAGVLGHPECL